MGKAIDVAPFVCEPSHSIHFSGGRTSALMLRLHLDAHGGRLPDGVVVLFCNTGKERPETLDFVERCSLEWSVPVVWLEYRYRPQAKPVHGFEVVDYASASRAGEPFEQVIDARQYLPNVMARFCTVEMKIRTAKRYLESLGWVHWSSSIGLRADEPRRVSKLVARIEDENYEGSLKQSYIEGTEVTERAKGSSKHSKEDPTCPMFDAGLVRSDVDAYWRASPFDLGLQSHEGNCDLCFLKGRGRINAIMQDRPDLAEWWIAQEDRIRHSTSARNASFRADRPGYAVMLRQVQEQTMMPTAGDDDQTIDCFCGEGD